MSTDRLNDPKRLNGDAVVVSTASTKTRFNLAFTVWSKGNNCAAADIVPDKMGRSIWGVLYEIPDHLIYRETANSHSRKALDAIEGEGGNYERIHINIVDAQGTEQSVLTYVVRNRSANLETSREYAQHIIDGIEEHRLPEEYRRYVVSQIERSNPKLIGEFGGIT